MQREDVRAYVNRYCKLRDVQFSAYELYARKHGLTAKELFVLDLVWFAPDGCLQSEICERLSATRQTVSAIVKKFMKKGYVELSELAADRRSKIVRLTPAGVEYVRAIIPPAADAEIDAMAELSGEDIAELVRLTTLFSSHMKRKFDEIPEVGGMIINTGARTDTVQFYTEWLLRRFSEGYVLVRNPLFPNKVNRYELTPDKVDCVVFCSKNYRPILPRLHEITDRFNTYFHYTITAYGKDVEPGVPSVEESMETLVELSALVGKQRVAWRYDPVLLTRDYTVERHCETFERMAGVLVPHIDRCIFSFVEMYKKLDANMPEIIPLTEADRDTLAKSLGDTARRHGIRLQTCGTNGDFSRYGIHASGCMTLEALGKANGVAFRTLKHKGLREGCHCIESRDIGAYDTCLNGCKYCYANKNPQKAFENRKLHDPASSLLLGHVRPADDVSQGSQRSFLAKKQPNATTLLDL